MGKVSKDSAGTLRAWWRRLLNREDPDLARRRRLSATGRIVEGEVLEVSPGRTNSGVLVRYRYEVAGVEYESFDLVDKPQAVHQYHPGQRVSVRYDRRLPADSILG